MNDEVVQAHSWSKGNYGGEGIQFTERGYRDYDVWRRVVSTNVNLVDVVFVDALSGRSHADMSVESTEPKLSRIR